MDPKRSNPDQRTNDLAFIKKTFIFFIGITLTNRLLRVLNPKIEKAYIDAWFTCRKSMADWGIEKGYIDAWFTCRKSIAEWGTEKGWANAWKADPQLIWWGARHVTGWCNVLEKKNY